MKTFISLLVIGALLCACAVYTPSGAVIVDPRSSVKPPPGGGGKFCPPGQAKKGNC